MTVLITGLGYIGARLAEDLLEAGESVVAVENFFCTPRVAVRALTRRPGLRLVEGSISQPETLQRAFSGGPIRALVHLAAQPSAHPRAATTQYTERTNLVGARLVLEAALASGVERVVLGSSFKVYGDDLPSVVSESQPYGQVGDLAHLTKIYVEKLAEMLAARDGLRCVAVRLGITHGLGSVMKADPRFMTVPNLFAQLVAQGQPLTVHPTATRSVGFIHLADASAALRAALTLPLPTPYRAVNAVGECTSVGRVAELVRSAAQQRGLDASIAGRTSQPPGQITVETSLSRSSFRPRRRLAESVGEVVDHFIRLEARSGGRRTSAIIA